MMRRRRPLARAAMVGGGAYYAGKKHAQSQAATADREGDQEARLEALEQQQAPAAPAPVAAAPAAGGDDVVAQLEKLKGLLDAGVLSQDEFDAAKAKVLAG
jgi:hypothetical protein